MDHSVSAILSRYYDLAANDYRHSIEAAFAPLAQALIQAVSIPDDAKVLDLGCGTGVVDRALRGITQFTTGIDFSHAMTRTARLGGAQRVVNGDMHHLPFAAHSFDVIVANFAFNHTTPETAFSESHRTLIDGGWLWFQEWGEQDPLSSLVSDTFVEYMLDEPTPELDQFRDQMVMALPWDELETIDDIVSLLESTGFAEVQSETTLVEVPFASSNAFIDYKLAWPARKAELAAMPPEVRQLCRSDLEENVNEFREPDGHLIWSPEIYRFRAQKS